MTAFYVALGVVAAVGLLWLVTQVRRLRQAPRLLSLLGMLIFWALSWPFGVAANTDYRLLGLDQLDARTVEHALRLVATASLLAFILSTPIPARLRTGTRRPGQVWWWQIGLLALAVVALGVNTAATPAELRDQLAELANGSAMTGAATPVGSDYVARFFLIENVYYAGAFVVATIWVAGHLRRHPLPTALAWGLRVLLFGSATLVAATALLSSSALVRWLGERPPTVLTLFGLLLLSVGLLAVVLGVAIPSLLTTLNAMRILRAQRRTARELEPLWTQLREVFPDEVDEPDAGEQAPGGAQYSGTTGPVAGSRLQEWLSRGYYRTLIECRDGLHRLSPYLQATNDDGLDSGALPTGAQLLAAFELCRRDPGAYDGAPIVGADDSRIGLSDDVEVLVQLSRRLSAAQGSVSQLTSSEN